MTSLAVKRFGGWVDTRCPRASLTYFRRAFATVWLVYDVLDIYFHGTETYLWSVGAPNLHTQVLSTQIVLVFCEAILLIGWESKYFFLLAFAARAYEGHLFAINDFLYYSVVALLLSQCDTENLGRERNPKAMAWPRDALILQTAWIYLSSAFLKLNPAFLSGGDLFVRQNYMATALKWHYPSFYRQWISTLAGNAVMAWMAVVVESALAFLLLAWVFAPERRKIIRPLCVSLVLGVHLLGALALNVYFFGASLIVQVFFLTWEPQKSALSL